jgi:hypothetical protein
MFRGEQTHRRRKSRREKIVIDPKMGWIVLLVLRSYGWLVFLCKSQNPKPVVSLVVDVNTNFVKSAHAIIKIHIKKITCPKSIVLIFWSYFTQNIYDLSFLFLFIFHM